MNIGRTVRVFRAEPVVSPVPQAPVADREQEVGDAPPVRVDAEEVHAVRAGG